MKGLQTINPWAYQTARDSSLLESGFVVNNYQEIAERKGEADLSLMPYLINQYSGNDVRRFLDLPARGPLPQRETRAPGGDQIMLRGFMGRSS